MSRNVPSHPGYPPTWYHHPILSVTPSAYRFPTTYLHVWALLANNIYKKMVPMRALPSGTCSGRLRGSWSPAQSIRCSWRLDDAQLRASETAGGLKLPNSEPRRQLEAEGSSGSTYPKDREQTRKNTGWDSNQNEKSG